MAFSFRHIIKKILKGILIFLAIFAGLIMLMLIASFIPHPHGWGESQKETDVSIWLVDHGYHTGIILPAESGRQSWGKKISDLPPAPYYEIGWGDSAWYSGRKTNIWRTLFIPTASTLFVVAMDQVPDPDENKPVKEIRISADELKSMNVFIEQHFEAEHPFLRNQSESRVSAFYSSAKSYHAFYTCNHWTARALRAAGIDTPLWPAASWAVYKMAD